MTTTLSAVAPAAVEPAWTGAITVGGVHIAMGDCAELRQTIDFLAQCSFLGLDIETGSARDAGRWSMRCVTIAATDTDGQPWAVVLDPRNDSQADMIRRLTGDPAKTFAIHNASFDVPVLVSWGLAPEDLSDRVYDTLVTARLMPKLRGKMTLGDLAEKYLGIHDTSLNVAMKAAGESSAYWYEQGDIDRFVYASSAARDTTICLALVTPLHAAAVEWLTQPQLGQAPTEAEAQAIITEVHTAAQAMLHVQCQGLPVNHAAVNDYRHEAHELLAIAEHILSKATIIPRDGKGNLKNEPEQPIRPGHAADLMYWLEDHGHLPADWPRTATGKLKGDKKKLESLRHIEEVDAHLTYAETNKVLGDYLGKFESLAHPATGKIYPMIGTLGATNTGRQSASNPPIQQIPGSARPMISTGGERWVSIDWSSVEPMLAAYVAGEQWVLDEVLGGGDLYIPIARRAGLIPDDVDDDAAHDHPGRKQAKVIMLMLLYGGGTGALAGNLGTDEDTARTLRQSVLGALPAIAAWSQKLRDMAESAGYIVTAMGRVLPVDKDSVFRAVNYFHQGSACDLLMGVLAECKRRGLASQIRITVHDEIVCTEQAAAEIRDIMQHHNPCMKRMLGRTVTFPTDSHALPEHWAAV